MSDQKRYGCKEAFRRLDQYVDRALDNDERRHVEQHLEECAHCAMEFRFEESFIREVRRKLGRIEAPSALMAKISEALKGCRDDGGP